MDRGASAGRGSQGPATGHQVKVQGRHRVSYEDR